MNTNELEAFVTVIDKQSYSLAAGSLGISTSALSRRISSLEKRLTCQLLVRDAHRIKATSAGQRLLPHASSILDKLQEACTAVIDDQTNVEGTLVVFSSLGMAKLAKPVFQQLKHRSPALKFQWILSEGRQKEMAKINFDLMLHIDKPNDSSLIGRYLGSIALDYYASPKYLAKNGRINAAEDLQACDTIYSSATPETNKSWSLRCHGKVQDIVLQPKFVVGSPDLALELALDHHGIARLPKFMAEPYVAKSALTLASTEPQNFTFPIYAIYPSGKYLPEKIRIFIDAIKATINQLSLSSQKKMEP